MGSQTQGWEEIDMESEAARLFKAGQTEKLLAWGCRPERDNAPSLARKVET